MLWYLLDLLLQSKCDDSQSYQECLAYWMDGSDLGGVTQLVFSHRLKLTARWHHTAPSAVTLLPSPGGTTRFLDDANTAAFSTPANRASAGPALTAVKIVVAEGGVVVIVVVVVGGRGCLFVVPTRTI